MNNRYGFYGWFGHGSPTDVTTMSSNYNKMPRWCFNAEDAVEFSSNQVLESQDALDNLTNIDYPAITYSVGCDNTPFDNYHTDPENYNLAESFTVKNLTGGPAFLGNTRFGWTYSSYKLFQVFADLIEGGNRHLGVAELISKNNNTHNRHYLSYSHNLIGCPETQIYTSIEIEKRTTEPKETESISNNRIPKNYELIGNYPNPFNPTTNIKYALPFVSNVEIKIYNITGKEIKTLNSFGQAAGYNQIKWDGKNNYGIPVSSGVYIYTFKAISLENKFREFFSSSKLIMLK